ncbi:MAG: hypothetical protein WC437_04900 [Patescibacteria group bacterium]
MVKTSITQNDRIRYFFDKEEDGFEGFAEGIVLKVNEKSYTVDKYLQYKDDAYEVFTPPQRKRVDNNDAYTTYKISGDEAMYEDGPTLNSLLPDDIKATLTQPIAIQETTTTPDTPREPLRDEDLFIDPPIDDKKELLEAMSPEEPSTPIEPPIIATDAFASALAEDIEGQIASFLAQSGTPLRTKEIASAFPEFHLTFATLQSFKTLKMDTVKDPKSHKDVAVFYI